MPKLDQPESAENRKIISALQVLSLSLIWVLVVLIGTWVVNLLQLSHELRDVPSATIGISIIAVPVFVTIASVLTYVFVGLHKEKGKT
jgi:hypothetical protein